MFAKVVVIISQPPLKHYRVTLCFQSPLKEVIRPAHPLTEEETACSVDFPQMLVDWGASLFIQSSSIFLNKR